MEDIYEIQKIKSDRFLLWISIFASLLLSANTYFVYHEVSRFTDVWREIVSAGVAVILTGFILVYTIRKNLKAAKFFAYFEVLISAYYYIMTIGWDWPLIPAFGFTLILPSSLYYASKEIQNKKPQEATNDQLQASYDNLHHAFIELDNECGDLRDIKLENNRVIAEFQQERLENIKITEAIQDECNKLRDENLTLRSYIEERKIPIVISEPISVLQTETEEQLQARIEEQKPTSIEPPATSIYDEFHGKKKS